MSRDSNSRSASPLHFDPEPFRRWLDAQAGYDAMVVYVIAEAHAARGIVFDASAKAVSAAFQELEEPGFVMQLGLAVNAIPHLVDATLYGFMTRHGLIGGLPDGKVQFAGEFGGY